MGYYTYYTLDHSNKSGNEVKEEEILKALACINPDAFTGYTTNGYVPFKDFDDAFCEEMKWYSYEEDMKKLSLKFPSELFVLYGEGEESDDFWKEYFYNGKSAYCQGDIVYREQNAAMLLEEYRTHE